MSREIREPILPARAATPKCVPLPAERVRNTRRQRYYRPARVGSDVGIINRWCSRLHYARSTTRPPAGRIDDSRTSHGQTSTVAGGSPGIAVAGAEALAWLVAAVDAPWQLAIVGYVLGAVPAAFLLALYRSLSSMRRSKIFRRNPSLDRAVLLLAALLLLAAFALLVGLVCGCLVATEMAKW
ncbi:hypothetical protein [Georgenia sp. MJ170]|uniref:hypothetical protein n=1 Tax=Georgenia sunbinii TaxID=3117728 RepID=UPI002F26424D